MKLRFPHAQTEVTGLASRTYVASDRAEFVPISADSVAKVLPDVRLPEEVIAGLQVHQQIGIPTFSLRNDEHGVKRSVLLGWRSLVIGRKTRQLASILYRHDERSGKAWSTEITLDGPLPLLTLKAIATLVALPGPVPELGDNAQYECRFMFLPRVYVAAIWLRGPGKQDFFMPLGPPPHHPPGFPPPDPGALVFRPLVSGARFFDVVRGLVS